MSLRAPFQNSQKPEAEDSIEFTSRSATPVAHGDNRNPFDTPYGSALPSAATSHVDIHQEGVRTYFRSRRVKKEEIDRPWLRSKDPKEKWVTIIPMLGLLIGLGLGGLLVYDGLKSVVINKYCSVYSTNFSEGLDEDVWTKEAEVGGFGNHQFEETTITDENVFVRDGMMIIKPTLQDESLINSNSVINLTAQGICSSDDWFNCVTSTNTTNGTIVQPVKSGRINLKKKAAIKYGRIEVEAKLPTGDWLWPAIWMLPVNETYGPWPLSGEIDIMESRGNNHTYAQGGNNIMSSALHWGPDTANDAWWRTYKKLQALHSTYADEFHTFGLEWNEKYLFTYVDSRLLQVLYVNYNEHLWQRGNFPLTSSNGTSFVDPWSQTGNLNTPFDQDFYLIINLAVGGENGWFQDGKSKKPWVDGSPSAKKDFWAARDQWQQSWAEGDPEFKIRAVRVWQQEGYNGCSNGVTL